MPDISEEQLATTEDGASEEVESTSIPALDDVFGYDEDSPGDDSALADGQVSTYDANQAGAKGAADTTTETNPDEDTDTVAVRTTRGETVQVPKALAPIIEAMTEDYKQLQGEFTRRNQQVHAAPVESEEDRSVARQKVIDELDGKFFLAHDEQDGKGTTELVIQIADARARMVAEQALQNFIETKFGPMQQMIAGSLGDTIFERNVDTAIDELASEVGIGEIDRVAVRAETKRLAEAAGKNPDREIFLQAVLRVQSGKAKAPKGVAAPEPKKPSLPNNPLVSRQAAPNRTAPRPGQAPGTRTPNPPRVIRGSRLSLDDI